jgi:hypothetical protein
MNAPLYKSQAISDGTRHTWAKETVTEPAGSEEAARAVIPASGFTSVQLGSSAAPGPAWQRERGRERERERAKKKKDRGGVRASQESLYC